MKKIVAFLLILSTVVWAQDFDGIKIYINPGHGGHDPANDRYIPETGYWESEGNLTKGLYLYQLLKEHNAVVYISRTQNRDVDDLPLSQIDADANAHNVDYFHSIHSNAYNATSNYPLVLFRGYDDDPVFPAAKQMGLDMWEQFQKLDRQWTYWPYQSKNVRGDWSFYNWGTSGLGVLRYLNMPGTLSEGSFHDYLPNSFRLMNLDYRRHESIVLLRSFIKFYGLDPLPDGVVAGIVRSKTENVDYSYNYNSGLPNDKKKAIEHALVRLLPGNRTYITDYHKNGFFMFENVEPGTYQVIMDAGSYAPDTVQVTVKANATSFANGFLTKVSDKAPQVYTTVPAQGDTAVITHSAIEVTFSQPMDTLATEQAFSTQPPSHGYFYWDDRGEILTYALYDTLARNTEYRVVIDTTARNSAGKPLAEPFAFEFKTARHHIAPTVVDYSPAADSVRVQDYITVSFDFPMRKQPTEQAFVTEPPLRGTFDWAADSSSFIFMPDSAMKRKTKYTVKILPEARNAYGVPLDSTFTFTFQTRYYTDLVLLKSFPAPNATNISTRLQIFAVFSNKPDKNKIRKRYQILDSLGNILALRSVEVNAKEGKGILSFEPRNPLKPNAPYVLRFLPGLTDVDGLVLSDTVTIPFRTWPQDYGTGPILNGFESTSDWLDPNSDPYTRGVDAQATLFSRYSLRKISGSYSGSLKYKFMADSGGVCRLAAANRIELPVNGGSDFGIWVYGDFSHNLLELWFDRDDTTNVVAYRDTIDWAGWKMLVVPLDSVKGQGKVYFQSIVINQVAGGYHEGMLYLDDAQYDVRYTAIAPQTDRHLPGKFELSQNFPNPFNPTTTIRYVIPKAGKVQLVLYNILGQKVLEIVNKKQTAGLHEVRIDASRLASGVYLYRLKTGTHVAVRKMVILK